MQHYSWEVMEGLERVNKIARESAVVIFSISTCCMCHAIKRLFCGLGVHPTVYELDLHDDPTARNCIDMALAALLLRDGGGNSATSKTTYDSAVPVVFIGGKLVGAMDRVMASHINGTLVPLLKQAGALWL